MSKLSKKLMIVVISILIISTTLTTILNISFSKKYYLHQKRKEITEISDSFITMLDHGESEEKAITTIEEANKVIIAEVQFDHDTEEETINQNIQQAFTEKGIGFQRYWLWDQDFELLTQGERQLRLYNQEKLNYSLLINYVPVGNSIFAITTIVPNIEDAFMISSGLLMVINILMTFVALLLISLFIRDITKPLKLFELFAQSLEDGSYEPIEIHTNDELEQVANSLNSMGEKLTESNNALSNKNKQMADLLEDVTHELKTPISLIRLYTQGIKDGIDDGSFLDTISDANDQMAKDIDRLLLMSKIDRDEIVLSSINISTQLEENINKVKIMNSQSQLEFKQNIEDNVYIKSHKDSLDTILLNLITNAVKYGTGEFIDILLNTQNDGVHFVISNQFQNDNLDLNKITQPYYVGEASRNKELSGTGLGLSLVSKMCETFGYSFKYWTHNNQIYFEIVIPHVT
ncbi:HAMP domain-containing histidine kinase [Erysipelothrix inopinata]|uniref:histidine kinase n=1 Tax=Erysipelothrix inopinata TaxID=225084 RepID=A0A7G9RZ41_9FIRM|nr:HAMP domain-containing sensor histidine kinase [Erysipelothrix inopinata]QNN60866.1 HAMP domain-containing histidine kinase [Erysipelothrix inopinata]